MQVTRVTRSAAKSAILNTAAAAKVEVPKVSKSANGPGSKTVEVSKVRSTTTTKPAPAATAVTKTQTITKTSTKTKTKAKAKAKAKAKPVRQITVQPYPEKCVLPEKLTSSHEKSFVDRIAQVLEVDPTLHFVFAKSEFETFLTHKSHPFDIAFAKFKADREAGLRALSQAFFSSICSGIISQQLSKSAAGTIVRKLQDSYGKPEFPEPQYFIDADFDTLRSFGFSGRKVEYVKILSEEFIKGPELTEFLLNSDDEQVIDRLVQLKGLGRWSAQMFLLFGMKRFNVFAPGDLIVAKGCSLYLADRPEMWKLVKQRVKENPDKYSVKINSIKKSSRRDWTPLSDVEVMALGDLFEPNRSVFMMAMWRLGGSSQTLYD